MKKESKKHIKFISAIGKKDEILEELKLAAQKPTMIENKQIIQEQLSRLEPELKNKQYAFIFEKYMTNKTGKYFVICRNESDMQGYKSRANELFASVNNNIEVNAISSRNNNNVRQKIINKFKKSNQLDSLKLLFINAGTINNRNPVEYDEKDLNGIIFLDSPKSSLKSNIEKTEHFLNNCSNNSVIIKFFDSINTISRYSEFVEEIRKNNGYEIDFIETENFNNTRKLRDNIYSVRISDELKLRLMQEYKKETGKDVTVGTIYKGFDIGSWKANLRHDYLKGQLLMNPELIEKFEEEGILGERKRREQTTDLDKYNLFIEFHKKNPDQEIISGTIDEDGNPLGDYRNWLQTRVNQGTADLTAEQIEKLKQVGYLNLNKEEKQKISKQYNISEKTANSIITKYGSMENFIRMYKQGKAVIKNISTNKRGIILSKNPLSMEKKQKYLKLVGDIFKSEILNDTSKFIIEEDLINCLDSLSDKQKYVILNRYELDGDKKLTFSQLGIKMGYSRARIEQFQSKALKKISKKLTIYSIDDLKKSKNRFVPRIEMLEKMSDEKWTRIRLNVDIDNLNLSKAIIMKLRANGYNTIYDLFDTPEKDLFDIYGFGEKKIYDVIEKINKAKDLLLEHGREDEIKKLKEELKPITLKIDSYNRAYAYYMNEEDIFYTDGIIIPPSIIEECGLKRKNEEKAKKQDTLNNLEEQIKVQENKTDKLVNILEDEGYTVESDEHKYD